MKTYDLILIAIPFLYLEYGNDGIRVLLICLAVRAVVDFVFQGFRNE